MLVQLRVARVVAANTVDRVWTRLPNKSTHAACFGPQEEQSTQRADAHSFFVSCLQILASVAFDKMVEIATWGR